jgi:hypothetical protein
LFNGNFKILYFKVEVSIIQKLIELLNWFAQIWNGFFNNELISTLIIYCYT